MFKAIINAFNYYSCNENYNKKLKELRLKKSKIRVCFLIRENQKWSYQSVYELFEKSEEFEPIVLVSLLWMTHIGKDKTRNNLEENYSFFKEKGMNVQYAYENGQYLNLKNFKPDIVFYDQPWDLPKMHQPTSVSKFALTCYVPYGFSIGYYKKDYMQEFHKLLFRMFLEHEFMKERYEKLKKGNSKNCIVTGLPKFDEYSKKTNFSKNLWKEPGKYKIIYAPHHSFGKNSLNFATFEQNGQFILNYAKKHPEITWIFKPHPRFKYALLKNGIMTKAEVEKYYNDWRDVGKIHESGNYIDIFKTSNLLLTDCCSFLAEYMPSGNPIVQIMNKGHSALSCIGNLLLKGCYSVGSNYEIENILDELIFKKNDFKKAIRSQISIQVYDKKKSNAKKISDEILTLVYQKNGEN